MILYGRVIVKFVNDNGNVDWFNIRQAYTYITEEDNLLVVKSKKGRVRWTCPYERVLYISTYAKD